MAIILLFFVKIDKQFAFAQLSAYVMRDHINQDEATDDDVDREVKIEAVPQREVVNEGKHVDDVEIEQSAGKVLRFEEEDRDVNRKNESGVDLKIELLIQVNRTIFFKEENEDIYNAENSKSDIFIQEVQKRKKFQFFYCLKEHYDQT